MTGECDVASSQCLGPNVRSNWSRPLWVLGGSNKPPTKRTPCLGRKVGQVERRVHGIPSDQGFDLHEVSALFPSKKSPSPRGPGRSARPRRGRDRSPLAPGPQSKRPIHWDFPLRSAYSAPVDAPPLTAWDELELEVPGAPEGDHLSLRFRFDPKGPPPHAPCRALALRRDEELETQVVRHLRLVRVMFPPPEVPTDAAGQRPGAALGPGTLTGPLTGELLKHVRQHIEDNEARFTSPVYRINLMRGGRPGRRLNP